jgi:SAM-dependent methyltransferase
VSGTERTIVPSMPVGSETMSPALQSASNYYAWIASHFRPVLGRRVLDIGGGHGSHLAHIVDEGRSVTSLELSPECVEDMKRRFAGKPFEAVAGDITDPAIVEQMGARGFDTIVCVNVLEHIERDDLALRGMARILAPTGGRLFLLVPAHPLLYGTPDVLAGHFRRYRRRDLRERLAAAGLIPTRTYFFNGFGAIPYGLNSRILRPRTLSGPVDTQIVLFDRYCVPVLRRLESFVRMPFGQSLIAIASPGR